MRRSLVTTGRMVMMRSIGYKWDERKKKKSSGQSGSAVALISSNYRLQARGFWRKVKTSIRRAKRVDLRRTFRILPEKIPDN